jgi:hypothetical protein
MLPRIHAPLTARLRREPPLVHAGGEHYFGLAWAALEWLERTVQADWRTLETGSGASTVVLAASGAQHTVMSPAPDEHARIRAYCEASGISTERVTFLDRSSHEAMPELGDEPLDLILLDGAHGFPYPALDWFYGAQRLRVGGYLLLDDAFLKSVNIVVEYLRRSDSWEFVGSQGLRTPAFRKLDDEAPSFDWGVLDNRPRFNYLPPLKRAEAWARYRLFDNGPLKPVVRWAALRRSKS